MISLAVTKCYADGETSGDKMSRPIKMITLQLIKQSQCYSSIRMMEDKTKHVGSIENADTKKVPKQLLTNSLPNFSS